MLNPVSTYRIQFHKDFSLKEFEKIIPYLQQLGVSTLYASPIFEATPGSTHGYDVVNPHQINPEIGTERKLKAISKKLQEANIGWLQDIVPNHMAYNQHNGWLMDVLEKGQLSKYAPFFDVAWNSKLYHGRIMVPFLGSPLEEVIKKEELQVNYEEPRLVLKYFDNAYPLHLRSYATILKAGQKKAPEAVQQLLDLIPDIQRVEEAVALGERMHEFQLQLASLMKNADTRDYLKACLKTVNSNKELLGQIAEEQAYRLCYWQETEKQINFRRFFTVNSLICLNIQDQQVFEHYHQYIKKLLDDGTISGLRVDHVDGLYDPGAYMEQLRALVGEDTHITIEKILEPGEELPKDWPIQGNTGYDFLSHVNNLFTNKSSKEAFTSFYEKLVADNTSVHEQIRQKKEFILYQRMAGELDNLHHLFLELDLSDKKRIDAIKPEELKTAIGEFLIQCPVYRYYGNQFPLDKAEAAAVADILKRSRKEKKELAPALALLEEVLLRKPQAGNKEYNQRALSFYQRCMQFTGPLMAKGVEDTLMYTYNRFVAHNEVGDAPEAFGLSTEEFHQKMIERQQHWPLSINATSTHDTKRGEDVRARLNVLTDLPDEWLQQVQEWQQTNWGLKQNAAPDVNDEYLIYQTLVGAYPMPEQDEDNFPDRIQEYLQKALREAKRHSNWSTPNEEYERATKDFALRLLDKDRPFWKNFQKFHRKLADFGIVNSLAQLLLKFTCPGVPDVYQGTELWDLSLVDPDNRRAVGYEQRRQWLEEFTQADPEGRETLLQTLWSNRYSAKIKLWLVHQLLQERRQQAELFEKGAYIPLQVTGKYSGHVLAFARRYQQNWSLVAVPLHLAALSKQQKKEIPALDWKDTRIVLPAEAPEEWQHLLTNTKGKAGDTGISVKELFKGMPLALLTLRQPISDRSAGTLMHITSLPSAFGVGDFGPEARAFAGFLSRSRQKYWQILPLNPTEAGTGHSPYSSYSSMAGNTLLLSPELLAAEGLLDAEELLSYHLTVQDKAEFDQAEKNKQELFEKAYQTYKTGNFKNLERQFRQFSEQEAEWLDSFALYLVLKQEHGSKPWYEWPEQYKLRQEKALKSFAKQQSDAIQKVKWLQFLFSKQWQELKTHCNNLGIQFFGDLPFYVSYDSVDVWANPHIFSLDEEGNMTGVAGVPPDYFNEDGQLWGMPVFKWDVLKEEGYAWWIRRIRKNMELYDLLRLDHFRAFADYWDVPAGEKTAKNGEWKQGPGADFFKALNKELGDLPFIAEDLGDINDAVYALRDDFGLPGMRVLQFAFGDEMPKSTYIPHNYTPNSVAYTGTHDNNTTRGWYRTDLPKADRQRMEEYVGQIVLEKEVHKVLGRLAYASVAKIAVLPIQDILGLDETARMNMPASTENNWLWRLQHEQLTPKHEAMLREWCRVYHRG
ncbi:malto-oligosyltrehalose synthase [Flammeovirgaceae bacterium 311]|nr:malto-oligosyltrehalose synthase [Flammeovirgaceae bacterium 311]